VAPMIHCYKRVFFCKLWIRRKEIGVGATCPTVQQ
jgi:hypothetical protein